MAGNNQIQLLRGSRSNSTGKDTVSEALKTLSPGQPLYSKDENYLYIGGDEDGAVAPVTTDRIKKGNTYLQVDSNGNIKASSSNLVIDDSIISKLSVDVGGNVVANKLISLDKNAKGSIVVNAQIDDTSKDFPNIQIASIEDNKIKDAMIYGQNGIAPTNSSVSFLGTGNYSFQESHIQESYTHIIYGYDKNNQSSLSNRSYIKLYEGEGAPTVTISGNILPDAGSDYTIGADSNRYKDAYIDNVYAKSIISPTIDDISEVYDIYDINSSANEGYVYGAMCRIGAVYVIDAALPLKKANNTGVYFEIGRNINGETVRIQGSMIGTYIRDSINVSSTVVKDGLLWRDLENTNVGVEIRNRYLNGKYILGIEATKKTGQEYISDITTKLFIEIL